MRESNRQRGEQLEILPLDQGHYGFSVPSAPQAAIGILAFLAAVCTWRAASSLLNAFSPLAPENPLSLKYNLEALNSAAVLMSTRWMGVTILLLLTIAFITHLSKRIHARLNARSIAIACGAGLFWQLGAVFLTYWVQSKPTSSAQAMLGGVVSALLGLWFLALGARRFAIARQHMATGADEVLSTDPRPAILYLRSFIQDEQRAPGEPDQPSHMFRPADRVVLPGFWLNRRHMTFEEMLCNAMRRSAPVIAIGRPGEQLPRLGASRKYVPSHSWQAEVLRMFGATRFTCLVLGSSEGLQWELNAVLHQGNPRKVLLVFPQNANPQSTWASLRDAILPLVGKGELPPGVPGRTLAVVFAKDWRPVLVTGRPTTANYRKLTTLMMRHAHPPAG